MAKASGKAAKRKEPVEEPAAEAQEERQVKRRVAPAEKEALKTIVHPSHNKVRAWRG